VQRDGDGKDFKKFSGLEEVRGGGAGGRDGPKPNKEACCRRGSKNKIFEGACYAVQLLQGLIEGKATKSGGTVLPEGRALYER